jgi:hypothetical protein
MTTDLSETLRNIAMEFNMDLKTLLLEIENTDSTNTALIRDFYDKWKIYISQTWPEINKVFNPAHTLALAIEVDRINQITLNF